MSGLDLLDTDHLEDELDAIFPRCSPKSAPSTPASTNITFISSLQSDSNLNKKDLSPDLNQNRRGEQNSNSSLKQLKQPAQTPQMDNIVLSRRVAKSTVRMDVSSPSEGHDGLYEDVFRGRSYGGAHEDVYGRAYPPSSSGSSSPSSNDMRRGGSSSRERDGDSVQPVFLDTKIEIAGGREIFSRSRNSRHKRAPPRSEKRLSQDREVAKPLHYSQSRDGQHLYSQDRENQHAYSQDRENQHGYSQDRENQHVYSQDRENQHVYSQDRENQHVYSQERENQHGYSQERENQHVYSQDRENEVEIEGQHPYSQDTRIYSQDANIQDLR